MGDQLPQATSAGQAGQPVTPSQPAAMPYQAPAAPAVEVPGGEQGQFVSRTEAQQIAKNAADEALRQAQSMQDKNLAKVYKRIEASKAAGVELTQEQASKMIAAEEAQQSQVNISTPQAAQPQAQEVPVDPITRKAMSILSEEIGVDLTQNDPEWKVLSQSDDPEAFLASVREAGKQDRKSVV